MSPLPEPPLPASPSGPPVADVLVLQHTNEDGPGYLGTWLDAGQASWQSPCAEAGQDYPASVRGYRALAVLGGEWGANDDRPTLRQAEALIREADALGMPVIGHCLGGQLMARALGGRVERLPAPEVGWLLVAIENTAPARDWLGGLSAATVYQWHYDGVVELPAGAVRLAHSPACPNQVFALRQHLAMQFHIEITPQKIDDWMAHPGPVYPTAVHTHPLTVQSAPSMHQATRACLEGSEALAGQIYRAWRRRWLPRA